MKNRSVIAVILLPFITFGIYTLYWYVSTKGELNAKGAQIPTAWLLIIPLVNIWWIWKYYEGAEKVTDSKVNGVLMFVIALLITSLISNAICQDAYNNLSENPVAQKTDQTQTESISTQQNELNPTASQTNMNTVSTQQDNSENTSGTAA